jgi:hypothetical protein
MATHIFTDEQVQKFINAVGGTPKSEVSGGQFSTREMRKLAESSGGLQYWPKATDDPRINYAVDCVTSNMCGEGDPDYDERLYVKEIEADKALED